MRQLMIRSPRGVGPDVLRIAREVEGENLFIVAAEGSKEYDLSVVHVANERVESLLVKLQQLDDLHITIEPAGILLLTPPASEVYGDLTSVTRRSPIEIYLAALQSIGSWTGLTGYAAAAGLVVWIGLYTNTVFLLVAAMLIAPFAGPAMSLAVGTARGDAKLIGRGLLRYFASLSITVVISALLSLLLQQQIATPLMVQNSQVSAVALLLPVVAGAAGALNLILSERNSLVSGTAVGVLVAASLAPPAGVIGMGIPIGEWGMVRSGAFLLLLQLAAINLTGAITFRLFGLNEKGARFERGRRGAFIGGIAGSVIALAALLAWQFSGSPELQRSTRSQRAAAEARTAVERSGLAATVEANVRFTRADIDGQNTLLCVMYVQRRDSVSLSAPEISERLRRRIVERLRREGFVDVTPLVEVKVLEK